MSLKYLATLFAAVLLAPIAVSHADSALKIKTWGIQRQDITVNKIADAEHDIIVIEYSPDGTDQNPFSAEQVTRMKQGGKKVLAYLPVGIAESHRFYWNSQWEQPRQQDCHVSYYNTLTREFTSKNICREGNAGLIGEKDPDWDGSYEAKYWTREWWDLAIDPYLDRIYAAGYDGVYLGGMDAYRYWASKGESARQLADELAKLVFQIAVLSRQKMGDDFLVIPQNGMGMIRDSSGKWKARYFDSIDAIALESFFFDTTAFEKQRRRSLVKEYFFKKKPILVLEYTNEKNVPRLRRRIADYERISGVTVVPYRSTNDEGLYEIFPPMK